jgi:hypothetical protein
MSFLKYFCFYCASRFAYSTARAALRRPAASAKPCAKHGTGLLVTLLLFVAAGPVALILIGFLTR